MSWNVAKEFVTPSGKRPIVKLWLIAIASSNVAVLLNVAAPSTTSVDSISTVLAFTAALFPGSPNGPIN